MDQLIFYLKWTKKKKVRDKLLFSNSRNNSAENQIKSPNLTDLIRIDIDSLISLIKTQNLNEEINSKISKLSEEYIQKMIEKQDSSEYINSIYKELLW